MGDNAGLPRQTAVSMLDPVLLRTQPAELAQRLKETRGFNLDVSRIADLEAARKQIQKRTEELQNLRNTRSKAIGQAKAKGEDVAALMAEVAGFGDELKASEVRLDEIRSEILLTRLREREVDSRIVVTDAEIDNFIANNPDAFSGQEFAVAHILLRTPEGASPQQVEAVARRAESP